ncbi:ABC transporter permease [Haladaptatus salinisoli]|uniref:ABC transporter permease n=1 Tax=Haladaptatus salinisoli TaxID=2884876 RepID=UPI001D0A2080|nr:ABC transporter permease [Haladaptatus salinisoli]
MKLQQSSFLSQLGKWLQRGSSRAKLLMVPLIVFEIIFFIVPLLYLVRISLYSPTGAGAYAAGTWSIRSYVQVLTSDLTIGLIIFTVKFTVVVTVVTLMLAVLLSYAVWRAKGMLKTVLLFTVILPLLTTLVVKLYAWLLLLSPIGPFNSLLVRIGVIEQTMILMNNFLGTVVGQVYTALPYATLAIYSVMSTIEWKTVQAARDLGASRPRSFFEVVLPQTLPGISVATVITFAWGVGAYASPALLGSASETTFAIEVERLMLQQFNWPVASALSIILLIFVLISVLLMFTAMNYWGGDEMHV